MIARRYKIMFDYLMGLYFIVTAMIVGTMAYMDGLGFFVLASVVVAVSGLVLIIDSQMSKN
jgi:hypothetical protein